MTAVAVRPRISVNKLGEFLTTSSPFRRRSILRDQKDQRTKSPIKPRYGKVLGPIEDYLVGGGVDPSVILDASDMLNEAPARTRWIKDDNCNTALALEQFLDLSDGLPFDGVTYVRGERKPKKILISGVRVSIRPEFLLRFTRKGQEFVGTLKIHCIKDDDRALKEEGQEYVATLCHQWLLRNLPDGARASHKHCFSIDVFRRRIVHAPAASTKRMRDVEAACAEIATLWPTI